MTGLSKQDYLISYTRLSYSDGKGLAKALYAALEFDPKRLAELRWSDVNWHEGTVSGYACPSLLMTFLAGRRETIYRAEVLFYLEPNPLILIPYSVWDDAKELERFKGQPRQYSLRDPDIGQITTEVIEAEFLWIQYQAKIKDIEAKAEERRLQRERKRQARLVSAMSGVPKPPKRVIPKRIVPKIEQPARRKATALDYPPIETAKPERPPEHHVIPNEEWDVCIHCGHSFPAWKLRTTKRGCVCPSCRGMYARSKSEFFNPGIGTVIA